MMKIKIFIFFFLISSSCFSQDIIEPIENKNIILHNKTDYENYTFKDINNVLDKFIGKWKFSDSEFEIEIEVAKYFDIVNKQDALSLNVQLIKDGEVLLDTFKFDNDKFINGAFFNDKNNTDVVVLIFPEITNSFNCGHVSELKLSIVDTNNLFWKIEKSQLVFNKTANIFPQNIVFFKN